MMACLVLQMSFLHSQEKVTSLSSLVLAPGKKLLAVVENVGERQQVRPRRTASTWHS